MLVTLAIVICHAVPAGVPNAPPSQVRFCVEEIVTDSNASPDLTFPGCMTIGQIALPKWIEQNRPGWQLDRYKCVPGHYVIKGRGLMRLADVCKRRRIDGPTPCWWPQCDCDWGRRIRRRSLLSRAWETLVLGFVFGICIPALDWLTKRIK